MVKIRIVGGGPAGLYFAQLVKRADPAHEVTVLERTPPDASFGFGVVFSEGTMRSFAERDPQTAHAVAQAAVHWDAIEVWHRGKRLRSVGHGFAAISRQRLLQILQQGAQSVGVDLRFRWDVTDVAQLGDYDLLVGADGANSLVRQSVTREFGFREEVGSAKFIWFGSTKRYDSFRFVFVENEHGVFAVHAYPFDDRTSTFLVETDEKSWRAAGLHRSVDEVRAPGRSDLASMKYLEALFAPHLEGERLLGNNSKWLSFRTVRNATWHDGNVVLLGDAAHTAHFSVGSGTTMAMEDASALNQALQESAEIEGSLEAYEERRRPAVERIQEAAAPSLLWWERYRSHMRMEPEPFIFHFLTRTPRVTLRKLNERDPGLIGELRSWWHQKNAQAGDSEQAGSFSPLSTPITLGRLTLPNRSAFAATADDDAMRGQLVDHARAGTGLLLTAPLPVAGRPDNTEAWRHLTTEVHATSVAKIGATFALPAVLPPKPAEQRALVDAYRRAAVRAGAARFDALRLVFPSAERASALLELFDAARAAWPTENTVVIAELPLVTQGRLVEEMVYLTMAKELKAHGCDLLALSVEEDAPEAVVGEGGWRLLLISERVRREIRLPTMLVGGTMGEAQANTAVLSGRADVCSVGALPAPSRPG